MLYAGVIFDGADGMDHLPADLRFRIRINGKYTVIPPLWMDWDHNALAVVPEEHLNLYSSPEGLYKAEHFVVRMKISEGIELSEILNKHQAPSALNVCLIDLTNFEH